MEGVTCFSFFHKNLLPFINHHYYIKNILIFQMVLKCLPKSKLLLLGLGHDRTETMKNSSLRNQFFFFVKINKTKTSTLLTYKITKYNTENHNK